MAKVVVDEELKKAFGDLHDKVIETKQSLKLADLQIESLKKIKQRAELTVAEIAHLTPATKTYESVGRMFLLDDIANIKSGLESKMKGADEKILALENNKAYLDRCLQERENSIREMVRQKRDKDASG